jgi:allophanate hydrolase
VLAPADRAFFGYHEGAWLYDRAIDALGETTIEIDYAPFREVAALLYEGPWVAERQAAFEALGLSADVLDPSVAAILAGSAGVSAVETFEGLYRLQGLRRRCEAEWAKADILLLPTAPRTFTVEEMLADPLARNAQLGTYTNFCNLLGLSAIAVPAGFDSAGLPFGVTLVGPAFADDALLALANRLHREAGTGAGIDKDATPAPLAALPPPSDRIEMAVVGAHLSGMALNGELQELGAHLVARTRTAGEYRLFALPDTLPPKPGLVRTPGFDGPGIEVEVWSLGEAEFGRFVARIASPLGIGKVRLADGVLVSGFLAESWAVAAAEDITTFGGWRAYRAAVVA